MNSPKDRPFPHVFVMATGVGLEVEGLEVVGVGVGGENVGSWVTGAFVTGAVVVLGTQTKVVATRT